MPRPLGALDATWSIRVVSMHPNLDVTADISGPEPAAPACHDHDAV